MTVPGKYVWIIVKYASASWHANRQWNLEDSIANTYTGTKLNCPKFFTDPESAYEMLARVRAENSGVDYGVVVLKH